MSLLDLMIGGSGDALSSRSIQGPSGGSVAPSSSWWDDGLLGWAPSSTPDPALGRSVVTGDGLSSFDDLGLPSPPSTSSSRRERSISEEAALFQPSSSEGSWFRGRNGDDGRGIGE